MLHGATGTGPSADERTAHQSQSTPSGIHSPRRTPRPEARGQSSRTTTPARTGPGQGHQIGVAAGPGRRPFQERSGERLIAPEDAARH
jgi:hypothetical protein